MNLDPYQPPGAYAPPAYPINPGRPAPSRTPFILAAVGAWLASAYWAALTLLIRLNVAYGSGSAGSLFLPFILIALYALRGFQLFKGDPQAAQRIMILHLVGAVAAVAQMAGGGGVVVFLQSVKILIHIFGGIAAFFARKAAAAA